jgi:hypothetical protein
MLPANSNSSTVTFRLTKAAYAEGVRAIYPFVEAGAKLIAKLGRSRLGPAKLRQIARGRFVRLGPWDGCGAPLTLADSFAQYHQKYSSAGPPPPPRLFSGITHSRCGVLCERCDFYCSVTQSLGPCRFEEVGA